MQIYGMDHAALESMFQTDLVNGLDLSDSGADRASKGRHKISMSNFIPFLREQFYFVDIIILISYLIAGFFSYLNHNMSTFLWTVASVLVSISMYFVGCFVIYYYKSRFLYQLRENTSSIKVIRNGAECLISPSELRIGDLMLLEAGVILHADARIVEADNLLVNEAVVFSSTVSSDKTDEIMLDDGILPENQKNMLWKGSAIEKGSGKAIVVALEKDCYIEKTGGRAQKKQRSFFYNRQRNIGQFFCYIFLLLVILSLLVAVFVSARVIDAFLIMGVLLSIIILNPISFLTEWTYYRTAERLMKDGVLIQNIEAFDRIDQEKNLYFEGKKIVEEHLRFEKVYSVRGSEEENLLYYALCRDLDSDFLDKREQIETARNQYPVILRYQDDHSNLFSVFAKGGKSVLIAIGYWNKMEPFISSINDETRALITDLEKEGKAVYLMATYSFDFVPNRLETDLLLGNMELIGVPVYSVDLCNDLKDRLKQFKRLGLNSILISDYSEGFNTILSKNYGFSEQIKEPPEDGQYSIAVLDQKGPVVYENSSPLFREQAQIIVKENVSVSDLAYRIKCMFCGIKRCFNFLMIYLSLGAICVLPLYLYEQSLIQLIIPLTLLPVISLLACYFLIESVKNCTQSKRSLLLGAFCGIFALICAISNNGSALVTLEASAVLLSGYLAYTARKKSGIRIKEVVILCIALLLSLASLLFSADGWIAALLLSVLPTVCAMILDRFY